jgi:glycosyltransferase involved in cell wall biosynthesis
MKVGIITINYNNIEGLKKTVESITSQEYKEFEYIVIDGGSSDGSKEYLENNAHKFSYWISEKDKGIYNAMNKGILKSSAEYLLFINSGDELLTSQSISSALEHLNQDLVYFDLKMFNVDGSTVIKKFPEKLKFSYFIKGFLPHPATFIKRTLFDKIGLYNETNFISSDWEFFVKAVCKEQCSYKYINKLLSIFYNDGISSKPYNVTKIEREVNRVIDNNFSLFVEDYKRLETLELKMKHAQESRIIKLLQSIGLIKWF